MPKAPPKSIEEFGRYVAFGLFQLAVDTSVLVFIESNFAIDVGLANILSRISAALLGYQLNNRFNFNKSDSKNERRFYRFFAWWIIATLLCSLSLKVFEQSFTNTSTIAVTKIAIEGVLVCVTFIVFKWFVFK